MDMRVSPGKLSGIIKAPPSKSAAHRAVICAALAKGESRVSGIEMTKDMLATIRCASALGAKISIKRNELLIRGIEEISKKAVLDCGESGSTLRFFVPIAAALGVEAVFLGAGRLPERPISSLTDILSEHGVACDTGTDFILKTSGKLTGGAFSLPGNISSQYITGLLFALPLLGEDSGIVLTTPLESAGYVDITMKYLSESGIAIETMKDGYKIRGGQSYSSIDCFVEGDYSAAAFWLCAGAVNSDITITGLDPASPQGDRAVTDILKAMGAAVTADENGIRASASVLSGTVIDVSATPDLMPVLAVTAAFANGRTEFVNAGRLRIKECDRLSAMAECLSAIGADVEEYPDRLVVNGGRQLKGGRVSGYNDHRIVMAMSVAALACESDVVISGAECVDKSYPGFYVDFKALGGVADVIDMG